jgi:hypothetical protein
MSYSSRLTIGSVANYLLEQKLLTPNQVVDDGLTIVELSRRNRSFRILNDAISYLLKQGVGTERACTVDNEASAYRFFNSAAGKDRIADFVPKSYLYDAHDHVLVLQFLRDAENLREYHTRVDRFPIATAAQLGRAIGVVHRCEAAWQIQPSRPPWALSALQLPSIDSLREVSGSNIRLIKIVQQFPDYCELLDKLRESWTATTLIHGDLKWENCIVFSEGSRTNKLNLVDWELATLGDPCWDVGSIFADYLSYWVFSMPASGESAPADFVKLARWPLEKMQPAIGAFWRAYTREMNLGEKVSKTWLVKSVSYAAGRLVQTAFEHLQSSVFLTAPAVCLLQLSLNMLKRPVEATTHLLGLVTENTWITTQSN